MSNLLNSTEIATLFLDRELRIVRYTESFKIIANLIPSDIGRPIGDLVSKLAYDRLVEDARDVLRTLVPVEVDVEGTEGRSYHIRITPYRTTENVIDGLVLTFDDITATKDAYRFADCIVQTMQVPLLVLDERLVVRSANSAFCDAFAIPEESTRGQRIYELGSGAWDISELRRVLENVLPKDRSFDDFSVTHMFPGIGTISMALDGRRMEPGGGAPARILLAFRIKSGDHPQTR